MPNKSRFPRIDADFNNYINISIPYLIANKARLVLTAAGQADLTSVAALLNTPDTGWNAVYPKSQNAATRTTTVTSTKNKLRKDVAKYLRNIYADIPRSVLTQMDRDTLKIAALSDTRTAASVPAEQPSISVSLREHLAITLSIVDEAHPQSAAKPADVDAIEIEGAFLPASAGVQLNFPQESDFRHLATSGRCSYRRTYSLDQLRGTEFFRARYLNTRNEPSGWSEIVQVVVS